MSQWLILLLSISYNDLLLTKVSLHPLTPKRSLPFTKLFIQVLLVWAIKTQSSVYRIKFIKPSLELSVTTSTIFANNSGDNTEPWCTPTFTRISSDNFVPLRLLFLLTLFSLCLSFSNFAVILLNDYKVSSIASSLQSKNDMKSFNLTMEPVGLVHYGCMQTIRTGPTCPFTVVALCVSVAFKLWSISSSCGAFH